MLDLELESDFKGDYRARDAMEAALNAVKFATVRLEELRYHWWISRLWIGRRSKLALVDAILACDRVRLIYSLSLSDKAHEALQNIIERSRKLLREVI